MTNDGASADDAFAAYREELAAAIRVLEGGDLDLVTSEELAKLVTLISESDETVSWKAFHRVIDRLDPDDQAALCKAMGAFADLTELGEVLNNPAHSKWHEALVSALLDSEPDANQMDEVIVACPNLDEVLMTRLTSDDANLPQ